MKKLITILFILAFLNSFSQELYTTKFMKGYVQDGQRVSVWEYFDAAGELVIKIDYNTGNIYYLKKDTSEFIINIDGNWVKKKLAIYPTPIEGFHNFRRSLAEHVVYPLEARERGIKGKVYVVFDVNSEGSATNYKIVNDIGGGCGEAVISALEEMQMVWLSAQENGKLYNSRFVTSVDFNFQGDKSNDTTITYPLAKEIPGIAVTAFGAGSPSKTSFYSIEDALKNKNTALKISAVDNNISTIPNDIGLLKKLTFLDLERNQITELPEGFFMLSKLQELYLPVNKLKEIPAEIISLKFLRILGLDSNEFDEFPNSICNLKNLEALDLGNNNIKEIPSCITNLKKLRILILQNNEISELPEEIYKLKSLEVINLKGNSFNEEMRTKIKSSFPKRVKVIFE
jgi:hypothetical protein